MTARSPSTPSAAEHAEHEVARAFGRQRLHPLEREAAIVGGRPALHLRGHHELAVEVAAGVVHRPPDRIAPLVPVREITRVTHRQHPAIAVAAGQGQAARLLSAVEDRWPAWSQGRRLVRRVAERRVGRVEFDAGRLARRIREERAQHLQAQFEAVEPLAQRRQRDAELLVFAFVPARADAEDEPPAGGVIQDRCLLGEDRWMSERVRQHADSDPPPGYPMGQRGDRGQRLPAGSAARDPGIGEVVGNQTAR